MQPLSPDQRPVVAGSRIVSYFRTLRFWWRDLLGCFLLTMLVTPADPHSLRHFFLPLASGWMTFRYLAALVLYVFVPVAERDPPAAVAPAARGRDVVRAHFQSLRAWPIDLAACMFVTCLVAPSDTNDVWLVFFVIAAFWMTARWLGTRPSAK